MWNADDLEDEVLAMVVRTGLNTCMGSMVRQMLAPAFALVGQHSFILVQHLVASMHAVLIQ